MLTLWKSLVLPKLEYCSQFHCLLKQGDIMCINSWEMHYWERLSSLGLNSRLETQDCSIENTIHSFTYHTFNLQNLLQQQLGNEHIEKDYLSSLGFIPAAQMQKASIIYTWQIIEALVPNTNTDPILGIEYKVHPCHCRLCVIPRMANQTVHYNMLYESSVTIRGSKLLNCLPKDLRNTCALRHFVSLLSSKHLDVIVQSLQHCNYFLFT